MINDITMVGDRCGFSIKDDKVNAGSILYLTTAIEKTYDTKLIPKHGQHIILTRKGGIKCAFGIGHSKAPSPDGVVWGSDEKITLGILMKVPFANGFFPYTFDDIVYAVRAGDIYIAKEEVEKPNSKFPHDCFCGGKAYIGAYTHECSNPSCRHFKV